MRPSREQLATLLLMLAEDAGQIGEGLRRSQSWQYPLAMALRGYALEYGYYLARYAGPGKAEAFASHFELQALLCTGKLAPLRARWQEAAAFARHVEPATWQEAVPRAPSDAADLLRSLWGMPPMRPGPE
jgi:hypothetical protein